ncbi:MAG: SUMF1/EgtB/PvdO family nonheme iron enzyme, partial [Desulfobacterales bacterium]|nr:SUMF1/EgtB/PvdO family nonheme iron enzyme [Desulfobacterales bacterium]
PKNQLRKEIAKVSFAPITFVVGVVPVVVQPVLTVYIGVEAEVGGVVTVGIELTQVAKGGVLWTKQDGITPVLSFDPGYEIHPPTIEAYAETKGYVESQLSMRMYGVTGPGIGIEGYLKARGEAAVSFNDDLCDNGLNLSLYWGIDASFLWDLGLAKKISKLLHAEEVELKYSLYKHEGLIKRWNWGGVCGDAPSYLELTGPEALTGSVAAGSGTTVTVDYTLKNTGDRRLDWKVESLIPDGRITFDNQASLSGQLDQGQTRSLAARVNTAGMSAGEYRNKVVFTNLYDGGLLDQADGTRSLSVLVTVTPPALAAPVLTGATRAQGGTLPTQVDLAWTWQDAQNAGSLRGFKVYRTTTPENEYSWLLITTLANPSARTYRVTGLSTETTYHFAVQAYADNNTSVFSNTRSVTTGSIPGGGAFTNAIGQSFAYIPPGTFTLGSPTDELGRSSNETQHQVTLTNGFYLMTTEVTQGQWRAVMGTSPSYFSNCGDDCPVEYVSWNDCKAFITALNALEGTDKYRLPTEAEWEYAARAGSTTALANGGITVTDGSYDPNLDAMGWYGYNSCVSYTGCYNTGGSWSGCGCAGTHPVGGKQPNAWGLYDMHGNVWEWCEDWYGETYPSGSVTNPTGPATGSYRVPRGGSWLYYAQYCRSAYRYNYTPTGRYGNIGLRLARTQ